MSEHQLRAERERYFEEATRIAEGLRTRWTGEELKWNTPTGREELDGLVWFKYVHTDDAGGAPEDEGR